MPERRVLPEPRQLPELTGVLELTEPPEPLQPPEPGLGFTAGDRGRRRRRRGGGGGDRLTERSLGWRGGRDEVTLSHSSV